MISSLNNGFWEFNMIKHQFNPKFKQFNIQLLNNFHSKEREPGSLPAGWSHAPQITLLELSASARSQNSATLSKIKLQRQYGYFYTTSYFPKMDSKMGLNGIVEPTPGIPKSSMWKVISYLTQLMSQNGIKFIIRNSPESEVPPPSPHSLCTLQCIATLIPSNPAFE